MENIPIGKIIEKKIAEKGIKISDFAKALNCNRNNVYSIFNRENIDLQQLSKISKILGCDLLKEYQQYDESSKNIVVIEVDDMKLKEIRSDSQIKVHYSKDV